MEFQKCQRVRVLPPDKEGATVAPDPVPDTPERAHIFECKGPLETQCTILRCKDGRPAWDRERYLVALRRLEPIPDEPAPQGKDE
jgi:hypothetical protein